WLALAAAFHVVALVPLLVLTRLDFLPPPAIVDVPANGHLKCALEALFSLPAQSAQFLCVYAVPSIMARPIGHELHQLVRLAEEIENRLAELDGVDLVTSADVEDLAGPALPHDLLDAPTVVVDVDVVA